MKSAHTVGRIDALLPQTQCGRCGFDGCRPYAEAISRGQAEINRCAPGGDVTIDALASLLGSQPSPLNPECGDYRPGRVARVEEQWCLGCARCLAVCPVDAIVGAPGQMHTVIAQECTGCEKCIAPCPVNCIQMIPSALPVVSPVGLEPGSGAAEVSREIQAWPGGWTRRLADKARRRFQARELRLRMRKARRTQDQGRKWAMMMSHDQPAEAKRLAIEAMRARARVRRRCG